MNSKINASLTVENCEAEEVDSFIYLGANVTKEDMSKADIRKRVKMAGASFRMLDNTWKATNISRETNLKVFFVKSLILYVQFLGCNNWKLTKTEEKRIGPFRPEVSEGFTRSDGSSISQNKTGLEMTETENINGKEVELD